MHRKQMIVKYVPSKALKVISLSVTVLSAAITIQASQLWHAQSGELCIGKAVNSNHVKRRHVVCHNRNPSPPAAMHRAAARVLQISRYCMY